MKRRDVLLAVLSLASCDGYSPVQIQKTLFLVDRNCPELFDDEDKYNFQPYDYGPFDKKIYEDIEEIAVEGDAIVTNQWRFKNYKVTETGEEKGQSIFKNMPESDRDYIKKVSEIVRKMSFTQLVSAIYKAYPEMKANSIFIGDN